jgi:hypothetical protein
VTRILWLPILFYLFFFKKKEKIKREGKPIKRRPQLKQCCQQCLHFCSIFNNLLSTINCLGNFD